VRSVAVPYLEIAVPQPPQNAGLSGLLGRWLPDPLAPAAPSPQWLVARRGRPGILGAIARAATYEPLRNAAMCNVAKNFWTGVSYLSGTRMDSPTEKRMMDRYFGGGGGSYRLSPEEWKAALDYYRTYGLNTLVKNTRFRERNGGYRQNMNFAGIIGDDRLDGLFGTATGYFDKDNRLTGLSDVFDFDSNPRGHSANPAIQAGYAVAGKAVGQVEKDANTFCPRGSNPIKIRGGNRP